MSYVRATFIAVISGFLLSACANTGALTMADVSDLDLTNPQIVGSSVMTGGQPSVSDLARLRQSGVTTVVNLRTAGEDLGFDERAEAESLGMTYISLPVSTTEGLNAGTAAQLRAILGDSNGPAFVHCGSGNRVGAIYAIGAHEIDGLPVNQALEIGRSAGLTGFEPRVREILEAGGGDE